MVRNLRPGDKWIPGTIIERTGQLSYLVQVAGGQTWKCHIDHLRQMDDSPQHKQTTKEIRNTLICFPPSDMGVQSVTSLHQLLLSPHQQLTDILKEYMYHRTDYHISK